MPPKAEYWVLTKEQFNEIKTQINELGEKLLNNLQDVGFTKIKSSSDWLGLTVEKRQGDLLTFVLFSLVRELPQEFELVLRKWDIKNLPETCVDLYEKSFNSIQDFVRSLNDELTPIKGKLS
jgi:hypothetical protein